MGLLHIPRVAASCARGWLRGRKTPAVIDGVGSGVSHTYRARCGLLDVDVNAHMNHAAFLTHAELARWEWFSETGALGRMVQNGYVSFFVTGAAVRYRKEIGPLFQRFEVRSNLASIDERNLCIYHTFRYPEERGDGDGEGGGEGRGGSGLQKIRAQILVQAVFLKGRTLLDPGSALVDLCGFDAVHVDRLRESNLDDLTKEKRLRFKDLEAALKASASADDFLVESLENDGDGKKR